MGFYQRLGVCRMSTDLLVLFNTPMPSVQIWEAKAAQLGFPLTFDRRFSPGKDSGTFPMTVGDVVAAPEFFLEKDQTTVYYGSSLTHGPWKHQALFTFGSYPPEFVATTFATVSLAIVTNGVIFAPDTNLYLAPDFPKLLAGNELVCPNLACIYKR
jgi:hypothetical protein